MTGLFAPKSLTRRHALAMGGGMVAAAGGLQARIALAQAQQRPLVIALSQKPPVLDMALAQNPPSTSPTMLNITEMLMGSNNDGSLKPGLTSWTISPDGRTIEFKIRPGVKFHSGDPFTTADIQFTHERFVKHLAFYRLPVRQLDHIEIVDAQTCRFIYKQPDATVLSNHMAMYIESKAYFERVGEEAAVAKPVGTGPYKVIEAKAGQYVDLEAFADYWGGAPPIKKVRLVFVLEDNTRLAMLQSGEADLIMGLPWPNVEKLQGAKYHIVTSNNHPTYRIEFSLYNPDTPWAKLKVRQAIAHAIDTDAIIKGLFKGIPHVYPMFAPGEIGYDPDLKPYGYDPKQARQLLTEAGYPNGFKMQMIYWTGNYYGLKETSEAAALYLKQVGIEVELVGMDVETIEKKLHSDGKNPKGELVMVAPRTIANFNEPAQGLSVAYLSSSPSSMYLNPQFDDLFNKGVASMDEKQRGDYIRQAAKLVYDDVVGISLVSAVTVYAMKPDVDYKPTNHGVPSMNVADCKFV